MRKKVVAVCGIFVLLVGVLTIPMFGQSADRTKGSAGRAAVPVEEVDAVTPVDEEDAPEAILDISAVAPWTDLPEPSVTAAVARAGRVGGIDVAPALVGPAADGTLSVLVHFDPRADTANVAGADSPVRAGMRNFVNRQRAWVHYEYEILPNVVNVRGLTPQAVAALQRLPGVIKVEEDMLVHTHLNDSTPLIRGLQSQITTAGLVADGTGVRICMIDTGIDSNNFLYASRIDTAAGRNFVTPANPPEDDNGHGSHTAGIAAAGTGFTVGPLTKDFTACTPTAPFQGVAPKATLIAVKVLDSSGSGTFSNVIAGINYCANQTASGGRAKVISMSLGGGSFAGTCDSDTAAAAANNAVTAGVVVVASSGNDGSANAMGTPACGSKVIAVGATYDANFPNCDFPSFSSFNWGICTDSSPRVDQIACFSNRGTKLDVVAPGCLTYSADYLNSANGIIAECGTSMACPHVAGLAALIRHENPALTPAQVQGYIRSGAIDKGAVGFDTTYGYGRIDVINSLNLAKPVAGCTTAAQCDDLNACTTDTCVSGSCVHTAITCNDANACTTDTCAPATGCVFTPINCNDSNACTTDTCSGGVCSHTTITCNDSNPCTTDTCAPATGCVFTPINCNDSNACTLDTCSGGVCSHTAITCNDSNLCTTDTCAPATGCVFTPINCNDSNACTLDTCSGGVCSHTAITCNDSNLCTTDTCNPATGCVFTPITCPTGQTCVNGVCSAPTCRANGAACTTNAQCCSNKCDDDNGVFKCQN